MLKNLEIDECLKVLGNNYIGRLGYIFGQIPYIIPITFFHDADAKCIISYSANGHKLNAMRLYNKVTLQVDEIESLQHWKSLLVQGQFEELKGSSAKLYLQRFAEGIRRIMKGKNQGIPKSIKEFSSKLDTRGIPTVYRIIVNDIAGKIKQEA